MKKLVSLVLCFIIVLSPITATCAAAGQIEFVQMKCASNVVDNESIYIALKEGEQYICVDDAAAFSGYKSVVKGNSVEFSKLSTVVTVPISFSFGDENWIPLGSSFEKLDTSIIQVGSGLLLRAKSGNINDLYNLLDCYMAGPNLSALTVIDTENWEGNLALAGSFVYGVLSNFNLFDRISGNYKAEQYKSIFSSLMDIGHDKTAETLLKEQEEINGYINSIAKLDVAETIENIPDVDETVKLLDKWGISTHAANAYKATSAVGLFFDPAGNMYKSLLKDASFLQDIGISGTDIVSQMKLYNYVDSVINCSEDTYKMFEFTFFDNSGKQIKSSLPRVFSNCVSDIHKYYANSDFTDYFSLSVKSELISVLNNTVAEGFDNMLTKAMGPTGWVTKTALKATSVLINSVIGNVDETMSFVEKTRLLNQLQNSVYELYLKYRNTEGKELNAKYAAILYIKLYQIYKDLYEKATGDEIAGMDDTALSKILSLSDYDITTLVINRPISVDSLKKLSEKDYLALNKTIYKIDLASMKKTNFNHWCWMQLEEYDYITRPEISFCCVLNDVCCDSEFVDRFPTYESDAIAPELGPGYGLACKYEDLHFYMMTCYNWNDEMFRKQVESEKAEGWLAEKDGYLICAATGIGYVDYWEETACYYIDGYYYLLVDHYDGYSEKLVKTYCAKLKYKQTERGNFWSLYSYNDQIPKIESERLKTVAFSDTGEY